MIVTHRNSNQGDLNLILNFNYRNHYLVKQNFHLILDFI